MSSVGPNNGPGRGRVVVADMSVVIPASLMEKVQRPPQKKIDEFWKTFTTKAPGKGKVQPSFQQAAVSSPAG